MLRRTFTFVKTRKEKRSDDLFDVLVIEAGWNGFTKTLKRALNLIRK
jgi:hypothetical protein